MGLFKHIYKSTRLSHLLLGIVAICVLPSIQTVSSDNQTKSISIQQVIPFYQFASNKRSVSTKNLQHFSQLRNKFIQRLQAVTLIAFFAKKYQFIEIEANPIRAGPVFL
ncbi:secA translation cis-regulator SecM [Pasteurella atlantica]|uniref:SecA translation cis-regulator SecM n=2 Tax=Pasteurellaceae TaxID=712 RepID=A0ACC6HKH9_9PAST|nr:secA translation cis-regulator SecM [Pasteurella atlantica]MDP8051328.1 secA translation cis-regulator SecM [Pasteurella atlantica]MDP8100325.1 secA translation cis-regulator SecM [Pasteurella atlantica]MDP8104623.1 secA translation cis-regulator SecM [Pasteurella atlantica]MDP8147824.1 secA translation cis-regulator SecM [Pasteurella atlantica]